MDSNVLTREDAEAQSVALRATYAEQVRDGTSYSDLQDILGTAVSEKFNDKNDEDDWIYVVDFDDDSVVFCQNGEKLQAPYSVDGNTVTLGKASTVKAVTTYVPIETKSAEPDKIPAVPKRYWSLREVEQPIIGEMSIRSAADNLTEAVLVGWPSTTGTGYDVTDWMGEYRETINPGAFGKTLKESDYVPLLVDHRGDVLSSWHQDPSRTMDLAEDNKGLRHEARLDIAENTSSRNLVSGIRRGDYSKESFAFRATKEDWNEGYTERGVNELQLFDVSVVKSPANKLTSVGLRSDMLDILGREGAATLWSVRQAVDAYIETREIVIESEPVLEQAMRAIRFVDERMQEQEQYRYCSRARTFRVIDCIEQLRAGKTLSSANESLLKGALESLAQADNAAKTVGSAIAESRTAISTTLGTTEPADTVGNQSTNQGGLDTGKLSDGNPVLPNDGAGTRSIPLSVLTAQRQVELLKLRSHKSK
jgi:hypothetical protein